MFYLFLIIGSVYQVVVRSFRPRADTLSFLDPPPFGSFCDHLFLSHSWRSFFNVVFFFFVFPRLLYAYYYYYLFLVKCTSNGAIIRPVNCACVWCHMTKVRNKNKCKKKPFFYDWSNKWHTVKVKKEYKTKSHLGLFLIDVAERQRKSKPNNILAVTQPCNLLLLIISFCVINAGFECAPSKQKKKIANSEMPGIKTVKFYFSKHQSTCR